MPISQMTQMTQMSPLARYDTPMPSTLRKHEPTNDSDNNDEWELLPWGQALAYYRNRAGITQKAMAKAVGYKGASTAGTWEARYEPLNNDYLMKRLADLLDVDPDVLADGRIPRRRHDPKSELQAAGVSLKTIGTILGHSSISITADLYVQSYDQSVRDAADKMDNLFGLTSD